MRLEISTDKLVDPHQIGWIRYQEGDAWLRVKVIRPSIKGALPFLSHATAYAPPNLIVKTVEYEDKELWRARSKAMLDMFRKVVGEQHFWGFRSDFQVSDWNSGSKVAPGQKNERK